MLTHMSTKFCSAVPWLTSSDPWIIDFTVVPEHAAEKHCLRLVVTSVVKIESEDFIIRLCHITNQIVSSEAIYTTVELDIFSKFYIRPFWGFEIVSNAVELTYSLQL